MTKFATALYFGVYTIVEIIINLCFRQYFPHDGMPSKITGRKKLSLIVEK